MTATQHSGVRIWSYQNLNEASFVTEEVTIHLQNKLKYTQFGKPQKSVTILNSTSFTSVLHVSYVFNSKTTG
jgi:hypothetical protein